MITLIFQNTLCFEGQEKAGQGLCRRTLQASPPPRSASLRRVFANIFCGGKFSAELRGSSFTVSPVNHG